MKRAPAPGPARPAKRARADDADTREGAPGAPPRASAGAAVRGGTLLRGRSASTRPDDALRLLLAPPRGTNQLVFDAVRECFVLGTGSGAPPVRGLTRALARAFYPDYEVRHDNAPGDAGARRWAGSGTRRGSRVDRELAIAATAPARFSLESAHRFTRQILAMLDAKQMRLVAAQVPIYDAHLGLATAIDLLAVRAGRLVVLEIKCGFEDYVASGTGLLRGPVPMRNSPENQHQLQLLVECVMLQRCYGITVDDAYVVRAHAAPGATRAVAVEKTRLADWARENADALYAHLAAARRRGRPAAR